MDSGDVIQLIMLLILIGFSAIFSSAETALMTCNRIRLRSMENEGNKKSRKSFRYGREQYRQDVECHIDRE